MSWMDSWSRPSKHATFPPPLYLSSDQEVPYCHRCGRVIGSRKSQTKGDNVVKYCSKSCRAHKPGPAERRIEDFIVALLDGREGSGIEETKAKERFVKGDRRILVLCSEIESLVFKRDNSSHPRLESKEEAPETAEEWKSVDMEDPADHSPDGPVSTSSNAESNRQKHQAGQRRAEERELIRQAARRGVVFGFAAAENGTNAGQITKAVDKQLRKCEAVINGAVVEPSFAKGDWAIRWRE